MTLKSYWINFTQSNFKKWNSMALRFCASTLITDDIGCESFCKFQIVSRSILWRNSWRPHLFIYLGQISDGHTRIGLNLGVRTYFSTEDTAAGRLVKRHRAGSPGSQVPMCQAEGCKADLSTAKTYHRRHKVCELHSKAPNLTVAGHTQRFCQQCSR